MATSPDEVGLWTKLATGASGMVSVLVSFVWYDYKKRVENVETGLSKKADKDTVEQQRKETRETFIDLFRKVDDLKDDMNEKHQAVMNAIYQSNDRRKTPRE